MFKDFLKNPWNVVALVLLLLAICLLPFALNQDKDVVDSAKQACIDNAKEYNGKEFEVLGTKLKGKIYLEGNIQECKLIVHYLFILTTDLAENKVGNDPALYHYAGLIGKQEEGRESKTGTGLILGAERNATNYPNDLLNQEDVTDFYGSFDGPSGITPTPYFYAYFSLEKPLDLEGYKSIFEDNWFGVVDLKPYMERVEDEEVVTYTPNFEKAELEGKVVTEFNFVISE